MTPEHAFPVDLGQVHFPLGASISPSIKRRRRILRSLAAPLYPLRLYFLRSYARADVGALLTLEVLPLPDLASSYNGINLPSPSATFFPRLSHAGPLPSFLSHPSASSLTTALEIG